MEGDLFQCEIGRRKAEMHFSDLYDLLLRRLQRMIRNGAFTERGLARRVGLSQSHIHNVLNGVRVLTASTADRILESLGLSVVDLIEEEPGAALKKPPHQERVRGRIRGLPKQSATN